VKDYRVMTLSNPPVINGADFTSHEDGALYIAYGPKVPGVNTKWTHPPLAYLLRIPGTNDYKVFSDDFATVDPLGTGKTLKQYGRANLPWWKCTGLVIAGDAVTISKTTAISSKITLAVDTFVGVGDVIRQGGKDAVVMSASGGKGVAVDTVVGFGAGAATHHRKKTFVGTLNSVPVDDASASKPWTVDGVSVTEAAHTVPVEIGGSGMAALIEAEPISVAAVIP